jgi:anti-anti-sigma regulatory factor
MQITKIQEMGRVPVTVLMLNGLLNMGTTEQLENQAQEAYSAGARYLLIDLTRVTSLTSAGLRSILMISRLYGHSTPDHKQDQAKDSIHKSAHVKLFNPNPQIEQVLTISGFDVILDIHKDLKSAIDSF